MGPANTDHGHSSSCVVVAEYALALMSTLLQSLLLGYVVSVWPLTMAILHSYDGAEREFYVVSVWPLTMAILRSYDGADREFYVVSVWPLTMAILRSYDGADREFYDTILCQSNCPEPVRRH